MTREALEKAVLEAKAETKVALQTFYDVLNSGQKKKAVKDDKIRAMLDRYGVEYQV